MFRRLQYSRFLIGIILIAIFVINTDLTSNIHAEKREIFEQRNFIYPLQEENATYTCYLNSSYITRGVEDLILFFRFTYENETFIPNSYIYYNISSPSHEMIFEKTIMVDTASIFNDTLPWTTFISHPEGNYTIFTMANSTSTKEYIVIEHFNLSILEFGRLRMTFPVNPAYIIRNQNNDVRCKITNVGGNTVINVTLTNEITKTGTLGSVNRGSSIPELVLDSGESYEGNISFFPDTYLYQKHSFTVTYRWIDEPTEEQILISDPLEIICFPDIFIPIDSLEIPNNLTVGEHFSISYEIINNENNPLNILQNAECDEIVFDESILETLVISSGYHLLTIRGEPILESETIIRFWIDLEWETIAGNKWYTTFFGTELVSVRINPASGRNNLLNPIFIYTIIIASLIFGITYFSRNMLKGLTRRQQVERSFPEATYPLETVILDGSNIAWEEKSISEKPRVGNIEAMINRLSQANFKKIITVADAALRYQIDNQKRLDKLVKEGAIKMLPARVDGDKFILRLAEEENAMIVSNDMFKEFREATPWVDQRRIPYTILDGEVYLHPTAVQLEEDDFTDEETMEMV